MLCKSASLASHAEVENQQERSTFMLTNMVLMLTVPWIPRCRSVRVVAATLDSTISKRKPQDEVFRLKLVQKFVGKPGRESGALPFYKNVWPCTLGLFLFV